MTQQSDLGLAGGASGPARQGADPAGPFARYRVDDPLADLYAAAPPELAAKWDSIARALIDQCDGQIDQLQEELSRHLTDLGTAFRPQLAEEERQWPLNPMPILIGTEQWAAIARGVIQRARLLERVLADAYGPQDLVKEGHLPAAVLAGSRHFAPAMVGVGPASRRFLNIYAVDLGRGPDGEWRVLSDRVRLATGIGYALENRLALSRTTGGLLTGIHTRRLANFFGHLRDGIAASCVRDDPRIALLTPGRFNQSYPEQAHLARYLGFPLVEGRDLAVSQDRLYVRTIAGLKRIDAIWRWIDTSFLDPMAFDSRSTIGVPDLFDAWSAGQLSVVNWPGVGVVESRAFSAFLPKLSEILLEEPLLFPNIATWWCGQDVEREHVIDRLDDMMICSAFGSIVDGWPGGRTRPGGDFQGKRRDALVAAIRRRPMDYAGQEIVRISTTPALLGGGLEPRPFTMRVFAARDESGNWTVMPGGFARLSTQGGLRASLMEESDLSADICVVDANPVDQTMLLGPDAVPEIRRSEGILPSQAADNLFWFARYLERTEATARLTRALLGNSVEVDRSAAANGGAPSRLVALLARWGAIGAEQEDVAATIRQICLTALHDRHQPGSIATLLANGRDIIRRLRDRLAGDFWRLVNHPLPPQGHSRHDAMVRELDELLKRMSALSGLAAENVGRGAGWRFLDIGRRVERAANICRMARALAAVGTGSDDLDLLLELGDSQILYRSRYLTIPMRAPALDLLILDPANPRGFAFQVERLVEHLEALPHLSASGLPERQLRDARALSGLLAGCGTADLGDALLGELEARALALSDAISARYFLQYEREQAAQPGSFLA